MRIVFLGLVCLVVCGALVSPTSAWLTGYAYRQAHNLTGDASWAGDQTNYQVMITLNNTTGTSTTGTGYLNNHALQWGSATTWADIRITDSSDNLLPGEDIARVGFRLVLRRDDLVLS